MKRSGKIAFIIFLSVSVLFLPIYASLAQKSKPKATPPSKPPITAPPSNSPDSEEDISLSNLPEQIVLRQGNKIFQILIDASRGYQLYWTYYDDSNNCCGGKNFDSGSFSSFHAVKHGSIIKIKFSAVQGASFDGTHAPISLVGEADLETFNQPLSIFTSGDGELFFDVTDNSRPSTRIETQSLCITPQEIIMDCAIGLPPGYISPIPVH